MSEQIVYPPNGQVWDALVSNVHDGDTVTVDVDLKKACSGKDQTLGFHVYIVNRRLRFHNATRLFGINAAELVTPAGKVARDALIACLPVGSAVKVTTWVNQSDKYGRLLGRLVLPGATPLDLNQFMVDSGNAVIWYGQGPKPVP